MPVRLLRPRGLGSAGVPPAVARASCPRHDLPLNIKAHHSLCGRGRPQHQLAGAWARRRRILSVSARFEFASPPMCDVLDDRLAPAVDVRPLAVADAVLVAGHVDHVALALRRGHRVVRLLVGDDDQAVVLLASCSATRPPCPAACRCAAGCVDGIAQGKAPTRRHLDELVGEASTRPPSLRSRAASTARP